MKTSQSLATLIMSVCVTACGSSQPKSSALTESEKVSQPAFSCSISYTDTTLQSNPMYLETFDATPGRAQETRIFGVSPGDGVYFASIGPNSTTGASTEVALVLGNSTTGLNSMSVVSERSEKMQAALSLDADRIFHIACAQKH